MSPAFDSAKYLPVLYGLLALIPKNSLCVFELSTTATVNDQLGLLLRIRQQRLTNHQYLGVGPYVHYLVPAAEEVCHVTCLQLFLKDRKDYINAGLLIGRMISVTSLSITLKSRHLGGIVGGASETGREVVKTLFPPGYANTLRAKLRRLRIEFMSIRLAGAILPNVVPLDELKHLHLLRCNETDHFCDSLSRLNLTLESFCDEYSESTQLGMMKAFLTALHPLQELRVTSWRYSLGSERFDWPSLMPHAADLQRLEVCDHTPFRSGPFVATTRTLSTFKAFCERASSLQQLSMLGPAIEKIYWKSAHGLDAYLSCLRHIKTLRTLKITVYPEFLRNSESEDSDEESVDGSDDERISDEVHRLAFQLQLRKAEDQAKLVANHIFETLAPSCPHFAALVIDSVREIGDVIESGGFVRSKQTDIFGNTTYVGVPVEKSAIKYYVPCSGILECAQEDNLLEP